MLCIFRVPTKQPAVVFSFALRLGNRGGEGFCKHKDVFVSLTFQLGPTVASDAKQKIKASRSDRGCGAL